MPAVQARTCDGCGKPKGCIAIAGGYWHLECWRKSKRDMSNIGRPLTQAHKAYRAEAECIEGEDQVYPQMQWVNCEACGGTGEVIRRDPVGAYDGPGAAEYAEICAACEGTGRDCEPS